MENNAIVRYTFSGVAGSRVTVTLSGKEFNLLKDRGKQNFSKKDTLKNITNKINSATNIANLQKIACENDICDVCKLKRINLQGAKTLLASIVKMQYKYPILRSYTRFIGSHQQLKKILKSCKFSIKKVLKEFKIDNILNKNNGKQVANLLLGVLNNLLEQSDTFIATTFYAFGLFDAVLVDEQDYSIKRYSQLLKEIVYSERGGLYPKGCDTPESVIYHEMGHLLDYKYSISTSKALKNIYNSYSDSQIKNGLSEYALTDMQEFFADAFCELQTVKEPRQIATRVGELIKDLK